MASKADERRWRRAWVEANPDKVRACKRRYREAHPDADRGRSRRYDAEAGRAAARRYHAANPAKTLDRVHRYQARKRGATVEAVDREVVLVRDSGVCGICGLAVGPDWHLDHIMPLARGGAHSYANVQVAHPSCNIKKGARG